MKIPKEAIDKISDKIDWRGTMSATEQIIKYFLQWQAENPCWDCNRKKECDDYKVHITSGEIDYEDVCIVKELREQYKKEDKQ